MRFKKKTPEILLVSMPFTTTVIITGAFKQNARVDITEGFHLEKVFDNEQREVIVSEFKENNHLYKG